MPRRHVHRAGDWSSVAVRLDEIISAHSGEDPFEEALTLLVARLALEHDRSGGGGGGGSGGRGGFGVARVNRLVAAARARWPGIVEDERVTRLSDDELARCAAVLDGVRLAADDLVGLDAIFEHVVARAAKGAKGQFFTPRHVIHELVEMMTPAAGERVVDPACGSGGFLWHALARAPGCEAWGFDLDPRAARVARVMLAARGAPPSRVVRLDSLRPGLVEAHVADGFDVVLTNPPFAGDVGAAYADDYELARGPRRAERDVLFVERCVGLLRPGGRYAIVLPHNKVGGDAWIHLRRWLLERTQVVAVLGLGRNTFQPHTGQKACVVIGRKRERLAAAPPAAEDVVFFISERDGKDHRGRLVRGPDGAVDHDLAEATSLVRRRLAGPRARRARLAEAG